MTYSADRQTMLLMHRLAHWLKRLVYIAILIAIIAFLVQLGGDPWHYVLSEWRAFLLVIITTGCGVFIQVKAFLAVARQDAPRLREAAEIWSVSAIVSVIAPLLAGIATRTSLLVRSGMSLSSCVTASLRQVWMGVEYALLLASLFLPGTGWPWSAYGALFCALVWLMMFVLRVRFAGVIDDSGQTGIGKWLAALREPIRMRAHPWFLLQIGAMALTYFVSFNFLGAKLEIVQAISLASVTVLISLIAFVPNGLGLTDVLWIFVAIEAGIGMDQAVSVALLIRLGHFVSASVIYFSFRLCGLVASDAW